MPATQRKSTCIYGCLTLDVDRHYIESVTATTYQEKGIITLDSNHSRGTVLPAPHGKGNKCDKNVKYKKLMHCHCCTNNRVPRWTFMDPCKSKVRPGAREESASQYEIWSTIWNFTTSTSKRSKLNRYRKTELHSNCSTARPGTKVRILKPVHVCWFQKYIMIY